MNRIVIKVGSAVLTDSSTNTLAYDRMRALVEFIYTLKNEKNYEVILVSSGAVAAGYTLLKLDKSDIVNKQALASLGQPLLLDTYRKKFNYFDIMCSQILLEASVFSDEKRLNNAKLTINKLLENKIVPIINENDTTAIEELVFGDNDQLAAYVTYYFNANMLVILTDIDGYYDKDPRTNSDANLQKIVKEINENELNKEYNANNEFATGGIVTKLKAANFLLSKQIPTFLTSGFDLSYAKEFLLNDNHIKGTLFKK